MYEGCVWYLVMPYGRHVYVLQPLVRPHVRHVCMLLPLVRPHVRHAYLGLYTVVSLKGTTTRIWSFGCGFACATAMGCWVQTIIWYNYCFIIIDYY